MTPEKYLRYQLALLLTLHSQQKVMSALADVLKLQEHELETLLANIEKTEPKGPKKAKSRNLQETTEAVVALHPEKAEWLRTLAARFSNKTFLPELKDVRRFFETHDHSAKNLKSRSEALPEILKLLASLDVAELRNLCEQAESGTYSSLGIISDHILGRERK